MGYDEEVSRRQQVTIYNCRTGSAMSRGWFQREGMRDASYASRPETQSFLLAFERQGYKEGYG